MMLAALVVAALCQGKIPPDTIASYVERVVLTSDRASVSIDAVVSGARRGVVEIPVAWAIGDSARLELPAGGTAEVQSSGSLARLLVRLGGVPGTARVGARFERRVAGDPFVYRLANITASTIEDYELQVELPPGRLARNVTYTVPPSDRRPGVWPMSLDTANGRRAVRLSIAGLAPGDVVSITIETAPTRHSWAVLIVAVLLAALYLVRFRDLPRGGGDAGGDRLDRHAALPG